MKHDARDGRDAAARARSRASSRPRPIRYDTETWIVMRNDAVLPAGIITGLRNPDGSEFFISVSWDLDPANRRLIGRFPSLRSADEGIRYTTPSPVVGAPDEDTQALFQRQEEYARKLELEQIERAKLYGP